MEIKKCNKCGKEYPHTLEYFRKSKGCKNNLNSICKSCIKLYRDIYVSTPEYKEKHRLSMKLWRDLHPEKTKEANKRSLAKHKDEYNAYRKNKYHNDPEYKLKKIASEKKYVASGRRAEINAKPEQREKAIKRSRIRRLNLEKRQHDYARTKEWRKENPEKLQEYNKIKQIGADNLEDYYLRARLYRLVKYNSDKKIIKKDISSELLDKYRKILTIKRELRNENKKTT